jgi:large repetitive protein
MSSPMRLIFAVTLVAIAFFMGPNGASGQSSAQKTSPTGTISGRVTVGGKAAAGIPVVAVAGDTVNRRDAAARSVTDGEGYYQITGLAPGPYQVWTLTPGFVAETQGLAYFPYSGSIKNVLLSADEHVSNIDLKLIRGGVITGRVTNAENKPVVEERISLQLVDENGAARFGSLGSFNEQMQRTDDRGIYRIYGLSPGRYKVSVGYDPSDGMLRGRRYQQTFYPGTYDESKASVIELKEGGEVENIDLKLGNAVQTYSVSGRVINAETRLPIARAGVRFTPMQPEQRGQPSPSMGIQADDRGEFSFDGFGPGRYSVVPNSEYYGGNFYGEPVYFEVVDKDVNGLELKAVSGLSLSGVISAEGLVTRDLLAMLPGLTVYARSESSSRAAGVGGRAVVGADGSFQITGLKPGRVSINVFTSGRTVSQPTVARIERQGLGLGQSFELQESISGLGVVLNYGTGVIRGIVTFAGGEPPPDARMFVNLSREGTRDGNGAQVDARGHFLIKNLAPGTYEVTLNLYAQRPQAQPQKQLVNVTNGSESEVNFLISLAPKQ